MFRTKLKTAIYITAFTTCLLFSSGCTSQDSQEPVKQIEEMLNLDAISGDNSAVADVYNTVEVTMGEITNSEAAIGSISYPISYSIAHDQEYGTVIFKSFQVQTIGVNPIAKGEVIAVLELIVDPIAKEEARIRYEKALQSYENSLEAKAKELQELQEDIAEEANIYQKQILELDYEVALEEYNDYITEQTEYIAELKEDVDLYSQESSEILLTSPCDGLVTIHSGGTGNVVAPGEVIATVYSLEKVVVTSSSTDFKYGDDVVLTISSVSPAITLQGKVISAPNILYNAVSNRATIAITSDIPDLAGIGSRALSRISIVSQTDYVENGIIIPSSALNEVRGNTGAVYVLENGTLTKKNVKFGYRGSDYTWILEGLEPGQKVTTR